MGTWTRPTPLTAPLALAQFTQPERGYLWRLFSPPFMHINEPVSSHCLLCSEEKQFSLNGKLITGQKPESRGAIWGNFPFLMPLGACVFCHCCKPFPRALGLEHGPVTLQLWRSGAPRGSPGAEGQVLAELCSLLEGPRGMFTLLFQVGIIR